MFRNDESVSDLIMTCFGRSDTKSSSGDPHSDIYVIFSGILSSMFADNLSGISSGVLSGMSSAILSGISSDTLSGIFPAVDGLSRRAGYHQP